jgi:hypothetical protein
MNDRWQIEGMPGYGGNCTDCGENLCAVCGGKWGEDGECELCSMSLEELEFSLPIRVQRREKKEMPCADCKRNCEETVEYEQRIYRNDDYGVDGKYKKRTYEISFVRHYSHGQVLLRTERHHSFRGALINAHKLLDRLGLKQREGKNYAD